MTSKGLKRTCTFLARWAILAKMLQGLDSAGQFYQQLVSTIGSAVGIADGEPYWNGYLGQWQVWVNFGGGCTAVVCDWVVAVQVILHKAHAY